MSTINRRIAGRLDTIAGFGRKRLAGIQDSLAQRLGRVRPDGGPSPRPSVAELLDVDREYRDVAGRDDESAPSSAISEARGGAGPATAPPPL